VVSYRLSDAAIVALHGAPPPINLLLTSRQIYTEAREDFWATTGFEVHPVTPNDAWWPAGYMYLPQPKPTYLELRKARFVTDVRKVVVRIDVGTLSIKKPERMPATIGLETCVEILLLLVKELCEVLGQCVSDLKVVEICWIDEFAGQVDDKDWRLRAQLLQPFTKLRGVTVRIGKLIVAESGRVAVGTMLREILDRSREGS
jgi:hypothetical protein